MTTEISKTDQAQPPVTYTREQLELIKNASFRGSSDEEFKFFMEVCRRKGLDPFSRQIYAIKRWDFTQKKEVMSFQIAIDGLRLIAERSGRYAGQTPPQWCGPDGVWKEVWTDRQHPPVAARVGVYRSDFQAPIYAVALYAEFVQLTRENVPNSMWAKMPANQLHKCSESLALRKAFPEQLSGIYTDDEMGQADNPPSTSPSPRPPVTETAPPGATSPTSATSPAADVEVLPQEIIELWSQMKDLKTTCAVLAKLKDDLIELKGEEPGKAEYYRTLAVTGNVTHANELKTPRVAKRVAFELWKSLQGEAHNESTETGPAGQ
jgi:phage recombination protein Bet